ncbi:GntR family transcriptional regulator [Methylopila sp. Yamaguchi]|uniref:GntR family transcriptional regulator n=1 Tax=Methylopila sp. Yamaguchi TaxID=1437817 RepID=UPI000CC13E9E|nr:GntR family transcriptional regulator [Methylopila sp. Yamaguchi]GBD47916.1 GntR family transcriptional regulator [Methylopila sp. Yamaguchi]
MNALGFVFDDAVPVTRQLTRALRNAIVTMQLRPGEMISEQEIATRYGVSRSPVREAFIRLGDAGLLRIRPQRGTLVVKISRMAVENARFVREAIECAVVREAAQRVDREARVLLKASLKRQSSAVAARDGAALFALDEDFHRLLAGVAGRTAAWDVLEDVKAQMDRVRYIDMAEAVPMAIVAAHHTAIAEAVIAADPDAAESAMRAHLTLILESMPRLAAAHAELFEP